MKHLLILALFTGICTLQASRIETAPTGIITVKPKSSSPETKTITYDVSGCSHNSDSDSDDELTVTTAELEQYSIWQSPLAFESNPLIL